MAKPTNQDQKKKSGGAKLIITMFIAGGFVPFGMPTLLVCCGLLPTLIALLTDRDDNKSTTATIGFMNLAGVFPFLLDLWSKGQTMEAALTILRDSTSWLVMLGSAAIGQLLLYIIPPMIGMLTVAQYEARIKTLKEATEELKKVWGADVANLASLDDVRKHNGGG